MEFSYRYYKRNQDSLKKNPTLNSICKFFNSSSLNKIVRNQILNVKIESITSRIGFSYAEEGWHPFVETLKQYQQNNNLVFEDSILSKLYKNYTPENLQEVILDHLETPAKLLNELPPTNEAIRNLWRLNYHDLELLKDHQKKRKAEGWIFFGPHNSEYGEKEFKRLVEVYNSIDKKGYYNNRSSLDMVNGYFLKKGNEKVFVLLQGNHRVSALKALGYDYVKVQIKENHPPVVEYEKLYKWTTENGGVFTPQVVIELFQTLFKEKGRLKAGRYGLLS